MAQDEARAAIEMGRTSPRSSARPSAPTCAGYIADDDIERLYRDVCLFRINEGASQIQQLIIARETIRRGG